MIPHTFYLSEEGASSAEPNSRIGSGERLSDHTRSREKGDHLQR